MHAKQSLITALYHRSDLIMQFRKVLFFPERSKQSSIKQSWKRNVYFLVLIQRNVWESDQKVSFFLYSGSRSLQPQSPGCSLPFPIHWAQCSLHQTTVVFQILSKYYLLHFPLKVFKTAFSKSTFASVQRCARIMNSEIFSALITSLLLL